MKLAILGGHLAPALSIIENVPKDWEIIFLGRKYVFEGEKTISLEYKTIEKLGIVFEAISTGRFQRKFTKNTIPSLLKLPSGFWGAFKILKSQKPDVILGFGSYIQFPVVLAASILKIPVVIHEQTLGAGASNKLCSRFAKKVCISWEESRRFFPKEKTILTGIPLRKEVLQVIKEKAVIRNKNFQIFVTGGSSGSHFINDAIKNCLDTLLDKFDIVHQTGGSEKFNDFESLSEIRDRFAQQEKEKYILKKFLYPNEFTQVLKDSDLVISRGGMNTVYEIFLLNKPALVIPIPFSQKNEQMKNARFLSNQGLAEILEQSDITPQVFKEKILYMIDNISKYRRSALKDLSLKNPADKIIKILKECAEKK